MLNVSLQELEAHIPELEAGHRLTLVREGKPFAEVVPIAEAQANRNIPRSGHRKKSASLPSKS